MMPPIETVRRVPFDADLRRLEGKKGLVIGIANGIADFEDLLNRTAARAPSRSLVTIEDVSLVTAALATDVARLITGDTIYIGGGYHIMG